MAPLLSWDDHEFFVSFAMTLGMQMFFFVLSAAAKSEKAFDFVGGLNFIAVAFYTLAQCGQYYQRQLLATAFVVASRLYLALFLAYRAMARGGDARFDELRNHPLRFVKMWLGQTVWVFLVSAPLIFLNSEGVDAPMGALDYAGIGMCSVGIFYEVVADVQKSKFRSDPANRGTVCASGLWKWTRHPNYFGEIILWWGVFVLCSPSFGSNTAAYATIFSPLFTTALLLLGSGIPTAEGSALARFYSSPASAQAFQKYFEETPPLFPFPPPLYRRMPQVVKRLLCFELERYRYVVEQEDPGSYSAPAPVYPDPDTMGSHL